MVFTIEEVKAVNDLLHKREKLKQDLNNLCKISRASISWKEGSPEYNMSVDIEPMMLSNIRHLFLERIKEIEKKLAQMGVKEFMEKHNVQS